MSGDTEKIEFDCPHCGMGFSETAGDALYESDVDDGTAEQCDHCKGWIQLQCVRVEIELECTKAPQSVIGN